MPVASGVNRYLKINSHKIPQLFSRYYNSVPERVINNRLEVDFADFTRPEYAKYDKITPKKWESCRGLGYSFVYNQRKGLSK